MALHEPWWRKMTQLLVFSDIKTSKSIHLGFDCLLYACPGNTMLNSLRTFHCFLFIPLIRNNKIKENEIRSRVSNFFYKSWNIDKISRNEKKGLGKTLPALFLWVRLFSIFHLQLGFFWYFICLEIHFVCVFLPQRPYMPAYKPFTTQNLIFARNVDGTKTFLLEN